MLYRYTLTGIASTQNARYLIPYNEPESNNEKPQEPTFRFISNNELAKCVGAQLLPPRPLRRRKSMPVRPALVVPKGWTVELKETISGAVMWVYIDRTAYGRNRVQNANVSGYCNPKISADGQGWVYESRSEAKKEILQQKKLGYNLAYVNNSNEAGNESQAANAQAQFPPPPLTRRQTAALDILSAVAGKAKDGSTEALIDDHIFKEMKRAHTSLSSHAACDTPKINDYVDELRLVAHGGIQMHQLLP